jgi:hypothetical protein
LTCPQTPSNHVHCHISHPARSGSSA